jgi:hypothetical protein
MKSKQTIKIVFIEKKENKLFYERRITICFKIEKD